MTTKNEPSLQLQIPERELNKILRDAIFKAVKDQVNNYVQQLTTEISTLTAELVKQELAVQKKTVMFLETKGEALIESIVKTEVKKSLQNLLTKIN